MKITALCASVLSLFLMALMSCDERNGGDTLPPDPRDWICESSAIEPTPQEIEQFCATADRGLPARTFSGNRLRFPVSAIKMRMTFRCGIS